MLEGPDEQSDEIWSDGEGGGEGVSGSSLWGRVGRRRLEEELEDEMGVVGRMLVERRRGMTSVCFLSRVDKDGGRGRVVRLSVAMTGARGRGRAR